MRTVCLILTRASLGWLLVLGGLARAADTQDAPAVAAPAQSALTPEQLAEERDLIRLLADTLEQVRANYVDSRVTERELVEAAIQGMMSKLDPYSDYIAPSDYGQFRKSLDHKFVGIGIHIGSRDGQLIIASPLYGTPAWRAGLRAGDRILSIGDTTTRDLSPDDAVKLLSGGETGSEITISVLPRVGTQPQSVTLKRETILVPTVLGYRRSTDGVWDYFCDTENKIAYIRLTAFVDKTADDLTRALRDLQSQGVQGLVLDLRFNPGGLLPQAIEVSDLFLHQGRIVSVVGRGQNQPPWDAREEGTLIPQGFPVAVLVNRFSASAAEIVSACLQDNKAAVIVGERTWGKASVQNVIEMEQGKSALKLTMAEYQRPSGKNIHRAPRAPESAEWGVTPDEGYAIAYSDIDMMNLGIQFNRLDGLADPSPPASDAPKDAEGAPASAETPTEFSDRQLEKALEYLRGRIHPAAAQTPAENGTEPQMDHDRPDA